MLIASGTVGLAYKSQPVILGPTSRPTPTQLMAIVTNLTLLIRPIIELFVLVALLGLPFYFLLK